MTTLENHFMDQIHQEMEQDNLSLINQVSELREALKDVIKYNCLGKTKKVADVCEITLGYRKN
jgi:hypothetical protein